MKRSLAILACSSTTLVATAAGAQTAAVPPGESEPPTEPAAGPVPEVAPPATMAQSASNVPPPTAPARATLVRFDAGYGRRRVFHVGMGGADIGAALGFEASPHFAVWLTPRVFIGGTDNGLFTYAARLGVDFEIVFERFRFAPSLSVLQIGIERAVRDHTLTDLGVGIGAAVRYDVLRSSGTNVFVRGAIDAGGLYEDGALYWGPTIGAGVDFELIGPRPSRL